MEDNLNKWVRDIFSHLSKKYKIDREKLPDIIADWEDLKEDMLEYVCPECGYTGKRKATDLMRK